MFLIKSASLTATSLTPTSDLNLPEVTTAAAIPEALKVEVSKSAIVVSDKVVLKMNNFVVDDRTPASISGSVPGDSPFQVLEKALSFEKGESKDEKDAPLILIADKEAPYELLKQVMSTAANAGFLRLKLVVIGGGE